MIGYNGVRKGEKRGPYKKSREHREHVPEETEDGMTIQEIANVMGLSKGEVNKILQQAIRKLQAPSEKNKTFLNYLKETGTAFNLDTESYGG